MKFTYYKKNDLRKFESRIKNLVLEKNYQFEKQETTLDKEKIISESSSKSTDRELIKIFDDKATITAYLLKHRKNNYLILVGQSVGKDTMGVYVNYNNKPFKQIGKSLISLPLIIFGGPVGWVIGAGTQISSIKSYLSVKGPLSKPIKKIISDTLGNPVE